MPGWRKEDSGDEQDEAGRLETLNARAIRGGCSRAGVVQPGDPEAVIDVSSGYCQQNPCVQQLGSRHRVPRSVSESERLKSRKRESVVGIKCLSRVAMPYSDFLDAPAPASASWRRLPRRHQGNGGRRCRHLPTWSSEVSMTSIKDTRRVQNTGRDEAVAIEGIMVRIIYLRGWMTAVLTSFLKHHHCVSEQISCIRAAWFSVASHCRVSSEQRPLKSRLRRTAETFPAESGTGENWECAGNSA